jgi:hypothetical protein
VTVRAVDLTLMGTEELRRHLAHRLTQAQRYREHAGPIEFTWAEHHRLLAEEIEAELRARGEEP